MKESSGAELWKRQALGEVAPKKAGKERLVSTYRPIETMLAASGKEPADLQGKDVLNIGAGRTHWGFELTKRYGVVARRFENLDIAYAEQSFPRRVLGKLAAAESVGDIKKELPYRDSSFDVVWCSYAPINWSEFIRITRPGGEIIILGSDSTEEMAAKLTGELGIPVRCQEIEEERVQVWASKAGRHKNVVLSLSGKRILVARKPEKKNA